MHHQDPYPCWSLRGVISLLTVTSVVMVGTITLAITLTTSFDALHSIATKNVLLILSNANVQATGFLAEPADAINALRNFTTREAWPLPTRDHTVAEKYLDYATALSYPNRLMTVINFVDGTRIFSGFDLLATGDVVSGAQIVFPPVNSTSNFTTRAQMYYEANMTKADPAAADAYSRALLTNRFPYTPTAVQYMWTGLMLYTANATSPRYAGFEAVSTSGSQPGSTLMVTFIAPLINPSVVEGPYGFVAMGLSVSSVSHMLVNAASISGATVLAYSDAGLLIATSDRSFEASYQFWQSPRHEAIPVNCFTDLRALGSGVQSNGTWFVCLRTVADYTESGVATAFNDGFGFSSTPMVLSKTVSGVTYVMASGPVRISYPGATVYILVSLEESSVTGDVVTGRDIAIGITCVAVVTVAMSSFVLVTVLLRPLTTVANRMEHAARLDDVDPMPASGMSEIRALQCSFDAMSTELSRIRSFVPHSVMAQNTDVTKEPTAATQPTCANSVYDPTDCELSFTETPRSSQRTRVQVVTDTYVASRHLNIALGLTSASVTVLVANCEGFLPQVLRASHDEATRGIANLVSVLVDVVKGQGGVLSFFHGDHFVATFNGAKPCASASRRAITAAALIGEPATFAAGSGDIACVLTVGVATGKCLVGNVGCVGAMNFSTIGAPFTQATALQRLNRQYRTRLLTTHRVMRNVDAWFHVRALDVIALPDEDGNATPTMIGTVLARKTPVVQDVNDPSTYLVTETADCDDVELRRQEIFAYIVQRQYNDAISCYRALRRHCRSAAAEVEPPVHSMPRGDDFPDQLPSLIDACRRNIKSSETENPSDASQTSTVVTSHVQHPALTRQ